MESPADVTQSPVIVPYGVETLVKVDSSSISEILVYKIKSPYPVVYVGSRSIFTPTCDQLKLRIDAYSQSPG
jgi:hypothetical protein